MIPVQSTQPVNVNATLKDSLAATKDSAAAADMPSFQAETFLRLEIGTINGIRERLKVVIMYCRRKPYLIINPVEPGKPLDPILCIPATMSLDKLDGLIEKVKAKLKIDLKVDTQ